MLTVTTATSPSPPPPQYSYQPCHNGSSPLNTEGHCSLVIAASGKKKKIQTGQPASQKTHWHELCSPAAPPNNRSCRGVRRNKMWLEPISSMKESAQEEIYLHQRLPKPTWHLSAGLGGEQGGTTTWASLS